MKRRKPEPRRGAVLVRLLLWGLLEAKAAAGAGSRSLTQFSDDVPFRVNWPGREFILVGGFLAGEGTFKTRRNRGTRGGKGARGGKRDHYMGKRGEADRRLPGFRKIARTEVEDHGRALGRREERPPL